MIRVHCTASDNRGWKLLKELTGSGSYFDQNDDSDRFPKRYAPASEYYGAAGTKCISLWCVMQRFGDKGTSGRTGPFWVSECDCARTYMPRCCNTCEPLNFNDDGKVRWVGSGQDNGQWGQKREPARLPASLSSVNWRMADDVIFLLHFERLTC